MGNEDEENVCIWEYSTYWEEWTTECRGDRMDSYDDEICRLTRCPVCNKKIQKILNYETGELPKTPPKFFLWVKDLLKRKTLR